MNTLNSCRFLALLTFTFSCHILSNPEARAQAIPLEGTGVSSYAPGSQDNSAPGFAGRIHQARKNSGLSSTIARGNAQLIGGLIDPLTLMPFQNVAVDTSNPAVGGAWPGQLAVNPGGTFIEPGIINYGTSADGALLNFGNFTDLTGHADAFFPGLPGSTDAGGTVFDNGQNFAIAFLTFLDLPEGETLLGVFHDDSVEIAFHPNDARDIFRQHLAGFDSNSGEADRTVTVDAPAAGLYSIRVLLAQWTGNGMLEFYSADPANPAVLTLVNDANVATSVKAWSALNVPARPYITKVDPPINGTGIDRNTEIQVTMQNLGADVPAMMVNGSAATFTSAANGTETVLTHTPAATFASGETVDVEVSYGSATASWSFVAVTGKKALLVTGGGQLNAADGWVANRLGTEFGFDVTVVSDSLAVLADADGASLIFNSSTVSSGQIADVDFENLPIPLINVESANCDDFKLIDAPYAGKFGNNPIADSIIIEDPTHPMAAGLPAGAQTFATGNVQFHWGMPGANAEIVATAPNFADRGVIFGYEVGSTVIGEDLTDFEHPARRLHFGHTGNEGAALYNQTGIDLFDAAITWVLGSPEDRSPLITGVEYLDATREVNLTFRSIDGANYFAQESIDLITWLELDDSIPGAGESTTYTAPNAISTKRYYRVGLNE